MQVVQTWSIDLINNIKNNYSDLKNIFVLWFILYILLLLFGCLINAFLAYQPMGKGNAIHLFQVFEL